MRGKVVWWRYQRRRRRRFSGGKGFVCSDRYQFGNKAFCFFCTTEMHREVHKRHHLTHLIHPAFAYYVLYPSFELFGNCSIRLANDLRSSPSPYRLLFSFVWIRLFACCEHRKINRTCNTFRVFLSGKTLLGTGSLETTTIQLPCMRMYANTGKTGSQGRQVFLPLIRDYTLNSANHPPQHDDSWVLEIIACKINSTLELCSIENRILWTEETTTCKAQWLAYGGFACWCANTHTLARTCPLEC